MNSTATRTGKTLTVTLANGTVEVFKGKRAENAVAVSIGQWTDGDWAVSLHGTEAAAHSNAAKHSRPLHPGGQYWVSAEVVTVTE